MLSSGLGGSQDWWHFRQQHLWVVKPPAPLVTVQPQAVHPQPGRDLTARPAGLWEVGTKPGSAEQPSWRCLLCLLPPLTELYTSGFWINPKQTPVFSCAFIYSSSYMLTAKRPFQLLFQRIPRKKSLVYKAVVSQGQKLAHDFSLSYK